jgi:hypothetical protein
LTTTFWLVFFGLDFFFDQSCIRPSPCTLLYTSAHRRTCAGCTTSGSAVARASSRSPPLPFESRATFYSACCKRLTRHTSRLIAQYPIRRRRAPSQQAVLADWSAIGSPIFPAKKKATPQSTMHSKLLYSLLGLAPLTFSCALPVCAGRRGAHAQFRRDRHHERSLPRPVPPQRRQAGSPPSTGRSATEHPAPKAGGGPLDHLVKNRWHRAPKPGGPGSFAPHELSGGGGY